MKSTRRSKATRIITQDLTVDEFGELPPRKREAKKAAEKLGYTLGRWHKRPNDPWGRWNAFCTTCNLLVVVAVEVLNDLASHTYGGALTVKCRERR